MATINKMVLTWNDFETDAHINFRNLWKDECFSDVTLATEDDHQIRVHKVILSSCSTFFQNTLLKNPHQNPLIYLKDIQYKELELLVEFIYHGQCEVGQARLEAFLQAGRELKVKGLLKEEFKGLEEPNSVISKHNSAAQHGSIAEKIETIDCKDNILVEKKFIDMTPNITTEANSMDQNKIKSVKTYIGAGGVGQSFSECNDEEYQLDNPVSSRRFKCRSCTGNYKSKSHLQSHIESVHEGKGYPCEQCSHIATNVGNLTTHRKSRHESVRYKCDKCSKEFTQKGSLLRHKQIRHTDKKKVFNCDKCAHQEFLKEKLEKHKLSMHEGVWHECSHCKYRVNHAFMLRKHIQTKHTFLKKTST